MPRRGSNFVCQQCGYVSPSFLGRCPNCGNWNSLVEEVTSYNVQKKKGRNYTTWAAGTRQTKSIRLSEVKAEEFKRIPTGLDELDRVLGGGIVPGMVTLIAGEPGIGKSTLLLELARNFGLPDYPSAGSTGSPQASSGQDRTTGLPKSSGGRRVDGGLVVLYVAGEESASQIKLRAERLRVVTEKVFVLEGMDVDAVLEYLGNNDQSVGLVIVDSIQTLVTTDLESPAGSVGQVRECTSRLVNFAKSKSTPVFIVGHVTKEGSIAGPKVLEHMVDTVLTVEGEKFAGLRLVRTSKNRFGPTDEVGVFQMTDEGMVPIVDTTGIFTDKSDVSKPGACFTIALEGTRPMLVEIQSLVTGTPLPSPRRVASGIDHNRMLTIIATLQKRLSLPLFKEDVYVSVAAGLKLSEPATDLAIALAIISSYHDKALSHGLIAFGELDLLGNVRRVNGLDKRIKEAKKLGFQTILSSESLKTLTSFKL